MKPKTIQNLIVAILFIICIIVAVFGYNEYLANSYLKNSNCQYPMIGCYYSNLTPNSILYLEYALIISGALGAIYSIILYFVKFNYLKVLPLIIPVILLVFYLIFQVADSSISGMYP